MTSTDDGRILVHVQRREMVSLQVERELEVHCLEGLFWITQHRDTADLLLKAGQHATLTHPGVALLQALAAGRLGLLAVAGRATPPRAPRGWRHRAHHAPHRPDA